jgi:hypothetical protein
MIPITKLVNDPILNLMMIIRIIPKAPVMARNSTHFLMDSRLLLISELKSRCFSMAIVLSRVNYLIFSLTNPISEMQQ